MGLLGGKKNEFTSATWESLLLHATKFIQNPAMLPQALQTELVSRVDRSYRLLGLLGMGRDGIVLAALDRTNAKRAIKIATGPAERWKEAVYIPESCNIGPNAGWEEKEGQNEFVERFLGGIAIQRQLANKVLLETESIFIPAVGKTSTSPLFLEMDFVEGISLLRWVKEKNNLGYTVEKFMQLLRGMIWIHSCRSGVVLRDLKSEHFLITRLPNEQIDRLAIVDWTMAKYIGDRGLTQDNTTIGTVPFASPKQMAGESRKATPPDDIHALGFTFLELLLESKLPRLEEYERDGEEQNYRNYLASLIPDAPHGYKRITLRQIFLKATAIDERKRYQLCRPFLQDLEKAYRDLGLADVEKSSIPYEIESETINAIPELSFTELLPRLERLENTEITVFLKAVCAAIELKKKLSESGPLTDEDITKTKQIEEELKGVL